MKKSETFHLNWMSWPVAKPRGTIVIVHGVGEHGARYGHVAAPLNAAGFTVFAFDHRGHGRSPGKRGHINSWKEYRDDLAGFIAFIRAAGFASSPLFLFGHSMGAIVVLDFLLEHPSAAAGAIVSGAPIQPWEVANPFLIVLANILTHTWPSFTMSLGIKGDRLSRDEAVVQKSKDDPLMHRRVSARWGTEILATIERVKNRAAEIRAPMLVVHGGADRIDHPDGARWLRDHISSQSRKLIIYEDARHEVHNDTCRDQFFADIVAWLGSQT